MSGEPEAWTKARMQQQYPELSVASPGEVLAVDAFRASQGQPPSAFSQTAMQIASFAAKQKNP